MTSKEKARSLVERFMTIIDDQFGTEGRMEYGKLLKKSKECAIQECNDMIIEREVIYASIGVKPGTFWQEVIKEVSNL